MASTDIRGNGGAGLRGPAARKGSWLNSLWRMVRYRLHIPMKRSSQPPNHVARGVMVGTVWACTPLFGLQMIGSFLTWLVTTKLFRWNFSLVNALAWTWTTNVFTVIPCYYVFYLTGQLMLGRVGEGHEAGEGFHAITAHINATGNKSMTDIVLTWGESLLSSVGLPLAVGWVPWGIVSAWLAYRLSLSFVVRHRKHRAMRLAARRAAGAGADPRPTGSLHP